MRVKELIEKLQSFPPELPVMLKVYGCGTDSWFYLEENQVNDMMLETESTRICEIDVDNS